MHLATTSGLLHEYDAWIQEIRACLAVAHKVTAPAEDHGPLSVKLENEVVTAAAHALEDCTVAVSKALMFLNNLLDKDDARSDRSSIEENVATGIYADAPGGSPDDSEEDEMTETGDEFDDDDDDDIDLPDIEPVYGDEAEKLNWVVIARIQAALADDARFEAFKMQAMDFGTGKQSADEFYMYLETQMAENLIAEFILDFARLLANPDQRINLLTAHVQAQKQREKAKPHHRKSSVASSTNDDGGETEGFDFPPELYLDTVNHLMFVIHGIGRHGDFKENEFVEQTTEATTAGSNRAFREMFRTMQSSHFKEIPLALEIQNIEWHEELHDPTGVDSVFDIICPEGSQGIRQFNKDTFMDILYYLSPNYGQIVINSVTEQLNTKYKVFMDEHPGWNGQISIFAHSLGTVITYDILTHPAGSVAKNGVKFSGLDFDVENFFAAGSPVPVMILSRGDLDLQDGKFNPGIKMPKCTNYYNIFHPIDPIAYRIEPLIHPDMHDKPPVQLIQAQHCKHMTFSKMQELWERITAPASGFTSPRIDYVMRRRGREGVIEMAYAAASHSACWDSDDVVMFTLMQICRPVVNKLRRYMSAQRPLPALCPKGLVPITPHTKVHIATTVLARDRATGVWQSRTLVMDHKRVYLSSNADDVGCRKRWSIPLHKKMGVQLGDDAFTLKVTPHDPPTPVAMNLFSASPPSSNAVQATQILRATTTELRNEWLDAINHAIHALPHPVLPQPAGILSTGLDLPNGASIEYFGALKTSMLQFKTLKAKSWYETQGWNNKWFVLTESALDCYETCPNLLSLVQFPVYKATVLAYPKRCLLRIVTKTGTTLDFKVKDSRTFDLWKQNLEQIERCVVKLQEDVIERSALGVSLDSQLPATHRLTVDKFFVLNDDKGQYAAFQIRASGGPTILRRFSAFRELHRQLRLIFPHEQMPPLPSTRLWGKVDPVYLAAKCKYLNTYLCHIETMCANNIRGTSTLDQFLDANKVSPTYGDE
ncbi:Aste57867_16765 [Aphanomyces stellatus]|uniref:Aste57867_16765 protein n=1 Tax=Aphanomyces stellatus TaxID=120398 RepID=A0A485L665_9STRA|nr:hypothetical protein As57867_016708 [Aphanomyces stellatus]VFT93530.1 Aste57867_16765 [Aphanomyces stellatus]